MIKLLTTSDKILYKNKNIHSITGVPKFVTYPFAYSDWLDFSPTIQELKIIETNENLEIQKTETLDSSLVFAKNQNDNYRISIKESYFPIINENYLYFYQIITDTKIFESDYFRLCYGEYSYNIAFNLSF